MTETEPERQLDRLTIMNLRDMLAEATFRNATLAALADIRAQRIHELERQLDGRKDDDDA